MTDISAQQLFDDAFSNPRDPRSKEYKAGVMAALKSRTDGIHYVNPYKLGTAEADAFWSGADEGEFRWKQHVRSECKAS